MGLPSRCHIGSCDFPSSRPFPANESSDQRKTQRKIRKAASTRESKQATAQVTTRHVLTSLSPVCAVCFVMFTTSSHCPSAPLDSITSLRLFDMLVSAPRDSICLCNVSFPRTGFSPLFGPTPAWHMSSLFEYQASSRHHRHDSCHRMAFRVAPAYLLENWFLRCRGLFFPYRCLCLCGVCV